MKRNTWFLVLLSLIVLLVLLFNTANADEILVYTGSEYRSGELCVNDQFVYVDFGNAEVAIASYIGNASIVDIAESFPDKTVVGIMSWAFTIKPNSYSGIEEYVVNGQRYECETRVKKVIIPDTVRFVLNDAFDNNQIEEINIPQLLEYMGHGVFANNRIANLPELPKGAPLGTGTFYGTSVKTVVIPEGYEEIPEMCFWASRAGTYVIPSTVKTIGKKAFCLSQVSKMVVPEGVATIAESAFEDCKKLTSIELPNSLEVIGERAFIDCASLKSVVIPKGVTRIEEQTFCGCKKLASVSLPASVANIADSAFAECPDSLVFTVITGTFAEEWANSHGFKRKVIVPVATINLSETDAIVSKGKAMAIKAEISPENASVKAIDWESTDPDVATVKNGNVKGVANGKCDIICTATDGSGSQAICHVEVRTDVKSVAINEKTVTVLVGASDEMATAQLTYTILPEDAYWKGVLWESSDESIATVSEAGIIKGISAGKATITAHSTQPESKIKGQVQVVVQQAVENIELDQTSLTIPIKKNGAVRASVSPDNAGNKKLEWSSDDESIAVVNANGQITGKGLGKTRIAAKAIDGSGITATVLIEIVQPVTKIDVSTPNVTLAPSTSFGLDYSVLPEEATMKGIVWASSNEDVATVDEKGKITGIAVGTCSITGITKDGSNVKATVRVSVKNYDVIFTDNWGKKVDFQTGNSSSSFMGVTNRGPVAYYEEVTVSFKNGNVQNGGDHTLMPIHEGEDVVTVTVKRNARVVDKQNYTVYISHDAFQPAR